MIPVLQYGLLALFAVNLALWLLLMRQRFSPRTAAGLDPTGPHALSRTAEIMRALGALLLGLFMTGAAQPAAVNEGLDPSWQMVLEHATLHKLVYGQDIVFTFGPLAPVSTDLHNGAGYFHSERQAYVLWLASVFILLWWRLSQHLPRLLAVLSWLWLALLPAGAVIYAAIALLAWAMKPAEPGPRHVKTPLAETILHLLVAPAGLAVLGTVKFTYTVAALAVVAAWVGHAIVFQRSWKQALAPLLAATGTFAFVWTSTGQPLTAVPQWLHRGLIVSSAYADAMQLITVSAAALWLAGGTVVLALVLLITLALWQTKKLRTAELFLALVCLGLLAIVWKHSVTRADGHLTMIGSLSPLLCCLALSPIRIAALPRPASIACLGTVGALMSLALADRFAIMGSTITESVLSHTLGTSSRKQHALQVLTPAGNTLPFNLATAPELEPTRMPTFQALLKDQPVDVFNFLQCAAFANGLNYQPRPVYQSYQACNGTLMELNRDYWQARTGTHHLICRMESVDWRLSSSDDAACWPLWLTHLAPAAIEKDFILLSPSTQTPGQPQWTPLATREAEFGTALPVPARPAGTFLRLRTTIQKTLHGKLAKAAFQPDAVQMVTRMADGTTEINRVVPGALEAGILLAPFLHTNVDLLAYFADDKTLQRIPSSLTLRAERGRHKEFASTYSYTWETAAVPALDQGTLQKSRELLLQSRLPFPGRAPGLLGGPLTGEVMQVSLKSLINTDVDGRPALRLDAPSTLILRNDPRGGTLQISYMVPSPSWKRKKPTDGVRFVIATAGHQRDETRLLDHFLDPGKVESDREKKTFSVTLPPNGVPWIILRTETGPTDYQDRAIWGDFTWTPAPGPKGKL
ncbi:hypothetical protein [Verrucomicrobium sp. BvORR106]|uniref:hypothetical protein n=1 Tax=Verrucomicrobium sp. BvORR106 TaxID=1403819 RepID=UPI00056DE12D|nr:hypothetical protein [Verrucomicrobium sp. BvORR106]